jgi:hypothetical protein
MAIRLILDSNGANRNVDVCDDALARFEPLRDAMAQAFGHDARMYSRDAGEAMAFFVSQLAYTEQETYEKLYTPMQFRTLIPTSSEAGEYAEEIRYELMDHSGQGRRANGIDDDINMVDVAYGEKRFPVQTGTIGYRYTQDELVKSAFLRKPLTTTRLQAALTGYERHMNNVALFGEASSNLTGLYNNALVPQGNAPTGAWDSATPDQIIADINYAIQAVWNNTNFNDTPNTIVMAPLAMAKISSTARSANSDTTILEYVMKNNIAKQTKGTDISFQPGYGLNTAGISSNRRLIAYVKDPSRLVMHLPLALRFLAPQLKGLSILVPGMYKYSGVEFRYVKSAYYMDGI